ncbi:MAG: hypothetical protein S4CHLAM123_03700 [Chlamydiales bacterium]|nr:hypothetical protein [Chlamydiales bacterium]
MRSVHSFLLHATCFLFLTSPLFSQEKNEGIPIEKENEFVIPEKVNVKPISDDIEISNRLENILKATGWFENSAVSVNEGVVFLNGRTKKEEYKKWAGDLGRNTKDVTAVVNQIELKPSVWDYSKAIEGIKTLWRRIVQAIPSIIFGIIILGIAWITALLVAGGFRFLFRKRLSNPLLRKIISRAIGVLVFLFGLYIVFEVAGLTAVAFTIIGGTGILGIILGIAFKDISENILASIFLSIQNPFNQGDLVEIEGTLGYIQRLTMRATVLLSLEGNNIQIPNAIIYKATIKNYTSNPKRREDFIIGISYNDSIPKAQEIALQVLTHHPGVLDKPEPWVLVDNLGKSNVNLRIYFWLNGNEHSWLKVRSSVIRLIKRAFADGGITIPDEARERIFPQNIAVEIVSPEGPKKKSIKTKGKDAVSTNAESGLHNESKEVQDEASHPYMPEENGNLL